MATAWKDLSTGAKIRRTHTLFWWAFAFPLMLLILAWTAASTCLHARAILADHSIAQATIAYDEDARPSKHLARFKYTYTVDGQDYTGTFSTLNSRADEVQIGGTMPIAYANFDPSQSQRPALLESNADWQSNAMSVLTMGALGALLIGVFYMVLAWLLRRATAHLT
ncbi:DUF3592 domain-containing protein [Dokdonella immobilis]|uniref:DUF3592 domain-containing protein n=1 Tax=Dokdonella immobilis TaxID=578942 RepID=A0A1I4W1V4_9GAMM|nr:DUF3592 domain-containing protein [Dokdonella immobilis]SFN07452.1 hypothetical protein SAMN05216289_103273 [Dokdonella immobilis]